MHSFLFLQCDDTLIFSPSIFPGSCDTYILLSSRKPVLSLFALGSCHDSSILLLFRVLRFSATSTMRSLLYPCVCVCHFVVPNSKRVMWPFLTDMMSAVFPIYSDGNTNVTMHLPGLKVNYLIRRVRQKSNMYSNKQPCVYGGLTKQNSSCPSRNAILFLRTLTTTTCAVSRERICMGNPGLFSIIWL